jgi:hypothetical protein
MRRDALGSGPDLLRLERILRPERAFWNQHVGQAIMLPLRRLLTRFYCGGPIGSVAGTGLKE